MNVPDDEKFIKQVENLIDPAEVCRLFFFQSFRKFLPKKVFKKLLIKTSRKTPHMGFVIEPYSLFVFFRLKDPQAAQALLPDRYELTKAAIFEGDAPEYYFGIGNLNTRGSTFWCIRLESYLIARDKKTGLLSWIFFDILSNTIIAVPSEGIADPNAPRALFTTSSRGDIYVDIKDARSPREFVLKGNLNRGVMRRPEQELWVDGNTSIGHIKEISDSGDDPFAVIFDPEEVSRALDLPLEDFKISKNTLVPDFAEKDPCRIACFPYTQHYMADSPGCRTYVRNRADMEREYLRLSEMKGMKTFSTAGIRRLFFAGILVGPVISVILFLLLLLK